MESAGDDSICSSILKEMALIRFSRAARAASDRERMKTKHMEKCSIRIAKLYLKKDGVQG